MKLKKHIQRKFLLQTKLSEEIVELINKSDKETNPQILSDIQRNLGKYNIFAITGSNEFVQAFSYNYQGKQYFIPEPDPILVYFNSAYTHFKQIQSKRKSMLANLIHLKPDQSIGDDLYEYFGLTSAFVILLFTSLEAFINSSIPDDYTFQRDRQKRYTEVYTKRQIENSIQFNEKMDVILPQVLKKNFSKGYVKEQNKIQELKAFRDNIVHTKTSSHKSTTYDHLYEQSLNFKFEETLNAVAKFFNFYKSNNTYVTECPCSNNW